MRDEETINCSKIRSSNFNIPIDYHSTFESLGQSLASEMEKRVFFSWKKKKGKWRLNVVYRMRNRVRRESAESLMDTEILPHTGMHITVSYVAVWASGSQWIDRLAKGEFGKFFRGVSSRDFSFSFVLSQRLGFCLLTATD